MGVGEDFRVFRSTLRLQRTWVRRVTRQLSLDFRGRDSKTNYGFRSYGRGTAGFNGYDLPVTLPALRKIQRISTADPQCCKMSANPFGRHTPALKETVKSSRFLFQTASGRLASGARPLRRSASGRA